MLKSWKDQKKNNNKKRDGCHFPKNASFESSWLRDTDIKEMTISKSIYIHFVAKTEDSNTRAK